MMNGRLGHDEQIATANQVFSYDWYNNLKNFCREKNQTSLNSTADCFWSIVSDESSNRAPFLIAV